MMHKIQSHRAPSNGEAPKAAGLQGAGGFLLVLCVLLIVWDPIQLALTASAALPSLDIRGPMLGLVIVARVLVAAFGLAAGLALLTGRRAALIMVRLSIVITAAMQTFVYLTPFFPNNRAPGVEWIGAALSVLYAVGWLLYLARSDRVRNTFE